MTDAAELIEIVDVMSGLVRQHRRRVAHHYRLRRLTRPNEMESAAHRFEQCVQIDGFDHERIVNMQSAAARCEFLRIRRHHDDFRVGKFRSGAYRLRELPTRHVGHRNIDQGKIGPPLESDLHTNPGVFRSEHCEI